MRLDKFLAEMNIGSRSEVKGFIKKGFVTVNGNIVKTPEYAVAEASDTICFHGRPLSYTRFSYYLLNKPAGVVSATRDRLSDTVLSLLPPEHPKGLFPVGRLDKDTEGLLLITNDGQLAHQLLSPKKHVDKTYLVRTQVPVTDADIEKLCAGIDIGDDSPTLPAKAFRNETGELLLTIHEGRYHQVKRMLFALGNEVTYLKRIAFGGLTLGELAPGEVRALRKEELALLSEAPAREMQ